MTYKECEKYINDNRDEMIELSRQQTPGREVLGFFIAPFNVWIANGGASQYIFNEVIENSGSNEKALLDLSPYMFFSSELHPFIAILMKGQIITLSFPAHLEGVKNSGNAS